MAEPLVLVFDVRDNATAKTQRFEVNLKGVEGQLKRTGASSQKFDKDVSALGNRLTSFNSIVRRVTGVLGGLGIAFGVRGLATQIASFDRAIGSVRAVTGATESQFQQLTKTARDLGATTEFTATQAAKGLENLARAGFSVDESIGAVGGVLDLAIAGALDLDRASEIAANTLRGFNLEVAETGRVVDVLAKTAASSNTDINDLAEGIKLSAPIAKAFGLSIEQTSAALGVLSDAGLKGTLAGTGLRGILANLSTETDKANEVLQQLGLTFDDVNPQTNDLATIFERLRDGGLTAAQAIQLFDRRSAPAALNILNNTERLREFASELQNSEGFAANVAKIIGSDLLGAFRQAVSALQEFVLRLGDAGLRGILLDVTQRFTEFVRGLTTSGSAFNTLKSTLDLVRSSLEAIATVITARIVVGLVAMGRQAVITGASLRSAFAVAPVNAWALAIAAAAIGIQKARKESNDFDIFFRSFLTEAQKAFQRVIAGVRIIGTAASVAFNNAAVGVNKFVNAIISGINSKVIPTLNKLIMLIREIPGFGDLQTIKPIQFKVEEGTTRSFTQEILKINDELEQKLLKLDQQLLADSAQATAERFGTEFTDKFKQSLATNLQDLGFEQQLSGLSQIAERFGQPLADEVRTLLQNTTQTATEEGSNIGRALGSSIVSSASDQIAQERQKIQEQFALLRAQETRDVALGQVRINQAAGRITDVQAAQQELQIRREFAQVEQNIVALKATLAQESGDVVQAEKLSLELARLRLQQKNQELGLQARIEGAAQQTNQTFGSGVQQFGSQLSSFASQFDSDIGRIVDTFIKGATQILQIIQQIKAAQAATGAAGGAGGAGGIGGLAGDSSGAFGLTSGFGGGALGAVGAGFAFGQLIGSLFVGKNKGGLVGMQDGGLVPGNRNVNRDTVPTLLTPGEFVLTKEQTRSLGIARGQGVTGQSRRSETPKAEANLDIINVVDSSLVNEALRRREGRETIVNVLREEGVI